MKTLVLAVATLLCAAPFARAVGVVEAKYNPANGHHYYLLSPATWNDAEAFAVSLGGHLVTINDAVENSWIMNNFIQGHPTRNPWTGLNDVGTPGVWHWVSGEPVTYINFAPSEPNGIGAPPYGVNIFPESPYPYLFGQWNDAPVQDVILALMEVPEPSVLSLGALGIIGSVMLRRRTGKAKP